MPAITNDWAEYLKPEYSKEYYRDLFNLSVRRTQRRPYIHPLMIFSTHSTTHHCQRSSALS